MNAALAAHNMHAVTDRPDRRANARAFRLVTFIAPLLGGFTLGAAIGVLLWHLI